MFDFKWKALIVSMLIFQVILTWATLSLVDTAAYFARLECGEWCFSRPFGHILNNQSASDTANVFLVLTAILIITNGIIWFRASRKKESDESE